MTKQELIEFEDVVAKAFNEGRIRAPIHLSSGNEDQLIEIFKQIRPTDWVFSTHRSHYHALLHGIPPDEVMRQILDGHSMSLKSADHRFYTSSIVGGCLPIALGVAAGLDRNESDSHVYVFVGDMCATMGLFYEAVNYATGHSLPITFVVEDNGMSTDTPTEEAWGDVLQCYGAKIVHYEYERTLLHVGTGTRVQF